MILLIENQYLPSIIFYKISNEYTHIEFEQYETWQKMSFRNRCRIATANGPLDLSVPVVGGRNADVPVREAMIDNSQLWQRRHWRSIFSAYSRSPWFEHYGVELEKFYTIPYRFLWDWNLDLCRWVFDKLEILPRISFSERYRKQTADSGMIDFRNKILPSTLGIWQHYCPRYTQVFEDRNGFIPNLSIIDLLFCEGPRAAELLKQTPVDIQQLAAALTHRRNKI